MRYLNITHEAIDFQNDKFGDKLANYIIELCAFIREVNPTRRQLQQTDFPKKLETLLFTRFGLNTDVIFNTKEICTIYYSVMNRNHIFWSDTERATINLGYSFQKGITENAVIDLKKARLGGFFTKHKCTLSMDILSSIFKYGLSEKELAAMLLHEVGHVFSSAEFENRLESSNQVLANIAETIKNKGTPREKVYLLEELSKTLNEDEHYFNDVMGSNENIILGLAFFKKYIKLVKSQMPNNSYDRTSSEQMADNFAARFGYGKYLISSLDKMHRIDKTAETLDRGQFWIEFNKIAVACYFIAVIIGSGLLGAMGGYIYILTNILCGMFLYSMIKKEGETGNSNIYDTLEQRYRRIRAQFVERIKQRSLNNDELKMILEHIAEADVFIKRLKSYAAPLTRLSNIVFLSNQKALNNVNMQQLLEELSSNDLFVKSAELDLLAKT